MATIVLKTAKRKGTVSRSTIRKAVIEAYRSASSGRIISKKSAAKKGSFRKSSRHKR